MQMYLYLYAFKGDFVYSPNSVFELSGVLRLQVHLMALPSAFGVKFHKCAQVCR